MVNRGAVSQTLNAGGSYTIPEGYHNGSGKITASSLASQTPGTATANDIASGKTAWVNGKKITGTGKTYNDGYNAGYQAGLKDGETTIVQNMQVSSPVTMDDWGAVYTATSNCIFLLSGSAVPGSDGSSNPKPENVGASTNITTTGQIVNSNSIQTSWKYTINFSMTAKLSPGQSVSIKGDTWGHKSKNNGNVTYTYYILSY